MLFLLFQIGPECYALEAGQIVEVLPLLTLRELPGSPRGVAGIFNYRGTSVPTIDLCALMLDRPTLPHLSSRIILVNYATENGTTHLLGLMAERATEMVKRDPNDFVASGVSNPAAAYLGPVLVDERGLIQRIEVNRLLPMSVRNLLFTEPVKDT